MEIIDLRAKTLTDNTEYQTGQSYPLGATFHEGGVNFSIYSKQAEGCELLLFNHKDDAEPLKIIQLCSEKNKTFHYWHVYIKRLKHGQLYGYRFSGEYAPEKGKLFDASKLLLDPYTKAIAVSKDFSREAAINNGSNLGKAMKSVLVDTENYDWEGDKPLNHPYKKSIIYELHVGGITQNPNSNLSEKLRGTYKGLIEKIPYFKDLGVTTIELLPIHHFDEQDIPHHEDPKYQNLKNYWGYASIGFFAPHQGYSTSEKPEEVVNEFRDMVKAFHKEGLEIILDVVFNHTAEGKEGEPVYSFKGIDNETYYILEETDKSKYKNYSGCGNTLKSNHSVVKRMIMDSLKYWVTEMHVDGFRFDLAAILSRDEKGKPLEDSPILSHIKTSPFLAGTKIIAEPWDAAGFYKVGKFVGDKWAEWNDKFRDDVRRFVRGDNNTVPHIAARITGSADIFASNGETGIHSNPNHSINFICCHDGFTLNDLVSYEKKYNLANGENNRDGSNNNLSSNWGIEGETVDPDVNNLRLRQLKNFWTILLLSHGTPMIHMGDEVMRTKKGNNNTYCQDNELSWFDWNLIEKNQELYKFVKQLIKLNLSYPIFREPYFWNDSPPYLKDKSFIQWHGPKLYEPNWAENSHSISFTLYDAKLNRHFYFIYNAYKQNIEFEIPELEHSKWRKIIDTASNGFYGDEKKILLNKNLIDTQAYSVVVLIEEKD